MSFTDYAAQLAASRAGPGWPDQAIRHNPGFGIAPLMPHAALPADLREVVQGRWRGVGADPVTPGPRIGADDRAVPRHKAGFGPRAQRWDQAQSGRLSFSGDASSRQCAGRNSSPCASC